MQFGYMPRTYTAVVKSIWCTTDAIYVVRQLREKYMAKGEKVYFGFMGLEKAFDRIPREVIRWAVR